jgi:hypothetical protein
MSSKEDQPTPRKLRGLLSHGTEVNNLSPLTQWGVRFFPLELCRYVKLNYAGHDSLLSHLEDLCLVTE